MKLHWQSTKYQQKIEKCLDKAKMQYAQLCADIIANQPKQHQQFLYFSACQVDFEVCLALSQNEHQVLRKVK